MEKLPQPISTELPSAILYRDELERMAGIIRDGCEELSIEIPGARYTTIAELLDSRPANQPLHQLRLIGHRPYLTVEFHRMWLRLYTSDDSGKARGLYEQVKDVLTRSKRTVQPNLRVMGLNAALLGIAWGATTEAYLVGLTTMAAICAIIGIASAGFSVWLFQTGNKAWSTIYPVARHQAPSFLTRRKDELIFAIVVAILSSLITVVITNWVQKP